MTPINPPQRPRTSVLTDVEGKEAVTITNGALNVNATFSGTISGNSAAGPTGSPVPAAGDYVAFKDGSGNLVGVSAGNPLPVSASVTPAADPAEGVPGAAVPAQAMQIGGSDGTNLRTVATDATGQVKVLIENSPSVTINNFPATQPVSGTVAISNLPATQPVSGTVAVSSVGGTVAVSATSLPLPTGAATDATAANPQVTPGTTAPTKIDIIGGKTSDVTPQYQPIPLTNGGASVKTDGSGTTQPVSGTVAVSSVGGTVAVSAASLPLPSGASTDASSTNPQVSAGATAAPTKVVVIAGKTSDVTPQYQPIPLTNSGAAVKTDGSASTQPVSGTVAVNNFPGTQPVSGTVTGNQGTPAAVGNAWPVKVTDGVNAATIAALTNAKAIAVEVVDGNGTQITSFGGGTQFADNAASGATPTGTLSMGWDSANSKVRALKVDSTQNLSVAVSNFPATQPVSGTVAVSNLPATQPVSGTVTANIGSSGSLALDASVTGLEVSQGSTTSGQKGMLIQAAVTTAAPAYTTAQTAPLSLTPAGNLRVDGSSVTQPVSGTVGVNNFPATQAVSGTVTGNQGTPNTAANAWPAKITDGTNTAAVKAASTAAAATDPALVVAVSPNNSVAVTQATAANLNATAVLAAGSALVGSVKISDGTTVATVIAATAAMKTDLSSVAGTATVAAAAGVQKVGVVGNAGASVDATLAAGTAPTNGVASLAQFNATAPSPTTGQTVAAQSDARGNLLVSTQGRKATYRMAATGLAAVAGNSVTLYGSASKTVVITKIRICMSAATAALGAVSLNKYSTAPSGGTSTTTAMVPVDATDGAATATANNKYTAAPTAGTLIGLLDTVRGLMGSATVTGNFVFELDFGGVGAKPIVLSGTTQGIALNVVIAGTLDFMIEWTEE